MNGPLFKRVDCDVNYMVAAVDQGTIGLPDMQRPFVWPASKVRDLLDSMFKGYPIGYVLLWEAPDADKSRQIGSDFHGTDTASTLIIDGQQRLTSLYAVMKGKHVVDKDFKKKKISIAFRPLTGEFEVATAAHQKSQEWIQDISDIYVKSEGAYVITKQFTKQLKQNHEITEDEDNQIASNIERLLQLKGYPLSALQINSATDEEDVADIFVRVNSQGQKLNQADFILTLMSVFWEEGREELEIFCKKSREPNLSGASPYNYFIAPDPEQLLRVAVGVGFRRARLKYAYLILRGKDLETGQYSIEQRDVQFSSLKEAQARVLNLQNWHDFMKALLKAGYRSSRMITSQTALLYSYVLYLIGKIDYRVDEHALRLAISRWFFMVNLTGRYSSSPETRMEQDLADLRGIKDATQFVQYLDSVINSRLTNDFWGITLPNDLATASGRSPAWFAYCAALNLLDAKVLFSNMKVSDLLDPIADANKTALEKHHLFPKNYLASIEIVDDRDRNQIANFALVEWNDNIEISDAAPTEYIGDYLERFSDDETDRMYKWHALPDSWESLSYQDFLEQRRKLMSQVIKEGFFHIGN